MYTEQDFPNIREVPKRPALKALDAYKLEAKAEMAGESQDDKAAAISPQKITKQPDQGCPNTKPVKAADRFKTLF